MTNVTAEELEVLNTSYNKEHYMFHQQSIGEIIPYYSVGYSRKSVVQQIFIADRDQNIVADITNEIFFQGAVQ